LHLFVTQTKQTPLWGANDRLFGKMQPNQIEQHSDSLGAQRCIPEVLDGVLSASRQPLGHLAPVAAHQRVALRQQELLLVPPAAPAATVAAAETRETVALYGVSRSTAPGSPIQAINCPCSSMSWDACVKSFWYHVCNVLAGTPPSSSSHPCRNSCSSSSRNT
jgi:hypothetical protein